MDRLPTSREENLVYGLSFSIAFLASLDHEAYRAEIEQLLPYLQSMQKPHGGWGYLTQMTGDTSMTQHALLAVWELERAGFDIRPAMIENAAGWLLKTQDPSGAFGYQGTEAPGSSCVPQTQVGLSMGAAGASSLYLCCDLLGLSAEQEPEEQDALPRALKRVAKEPTQPIEQYRALSGVQVKWAQGRSNGWMQSNYRPEIRLVARPVAATNYYLYALERYWSFREAADGEPAGNADWYGDGVRFLASSQRYDGSWIDYCGPLPDTAFAVLFLVRSMKQGIERGRLVAEPAVEVVEPLEDAIELPSDVLALNQSGQQVELEVLPLVFPDRLVPQQTEPTDVLTVRLLAKPSEDYKVKWSAIDRIELFEDRFAEGAGGPDNERPRGLAPWAIQFMRGSTLESYALQLDFFGIELGVVDSWSELGYASGFAQSKPDLHSGPIAQENRRYFLSARGDKFREMDWELLRRAGVTAENPLVLKFLPPDWAEKMAAFEAAQPDGGRLTVFDVQREFFDESGAIPEGKGYSLRVSVSGDR